MTLAHEITVLHLASKATYGVPRIHAGLRRLGHRVNRKRIARVIRERGISGVTRRRRKSLTRPATRAVPAPDLIGRDCTASAPGMKLVGDITYIPTDTGRLYPATRLDLATREIVGYSMADHHRAGLVVDALKTAAGRGQPKPGRIVHSDRGSQYTSDELRREIGRSGLRQSMGRTGSCFDNAAAESSFSTVEGGDRNPPLARPDQRPRGHLRFRRDLLQPTAPTPPSALGLPHPARDPAAPRTRTRPRGVSIECPRSRGSFSLNHRTRGS
jgi:putative transposase